MLSPDKIFDKYQDIVTTYNKWAEEKNEKVFNELIQKITQDDILYTWSFLRAIKEYNEDDFIEIIKAVKNKNIKYINKIKDVTSIYNELSTHIDYAKKNLENFII